MDTLQIGKLAVRCHLSSASESDHERLKRLFHGPIGEALEGALSESGFDPRAEICIRRLVVPAQLWLGLTDAALLSSWAAAAIDHLRQALAAERSDEVVRYNSLVDAAIDAIRGSVRGRTARRWAWTQLGLRWYDDPVSTAAELFIAQPAAIVPAFRVLGADPAFRAIVERLDDSTLASVVDAALAYGRRAIAVEWVAGRIAEQPRRSEAAGSTHHRWRASAAARRSSINGLGPAKQSPTRSCALALLALLDAEPALLAGNRDAVAYVAAVAAHTLTHGSVDANARWAVEDEPVTLADRSADASRQSDRATDRTSATSPSRDEGATAPDLRRPREADAAGEDTHAESRAASESGIEAAQPSLDQDAPLDLRRSGYTDWAGLLFLLHAARDIDLARLILEDPALSDRSLVWVLQQLAMALVPAAADDAAVRAFAGLAPARGDERPLDEPGDGEAVAVLALARLVIGATCARLDRLADDEILYDVCARHGEIVADPGWIEVRVSLAQISTDVRRAGLDLDPDYIDWLGIVMKIKYV